MRADRLVAILLMLQSRKQLTAGEVAVELEISERTARRDLEALGAAGLPVYSIQGRNGGWRLLGGGTTDLSGLNATEAQALFLLAGPRPASSELRSALRKLVRALPEPLRDRAEAAATAVFHDPSAWGGRAIERPRPPLLDLVEAAVINRRELVIGYVDRARNRTTRTVHPLGVATKGTSWYLIAGTDNGQRTFRIDRMSSAEITDHDAVRPDGFVLADAWLLIAEDLEEARTPVRARILADPSAMPWMRHAFSGRLRVAAAVEDGRVEVEVRGHTGESLAKEFAGFGDRVEIVGPESVRVALRSIGSQLTEKYGTDQARMRDPAGS